jgi:predicted nucleic acid-binding protein
LAWQIAVKTGLKGTDAIVVQIAKENACPLVSLDKEMTKKAQNIVEIKKVEELL